MRLAVIIDVYEPCALDLLQAHFKIYAHRTNTEAYETVYTQNKDATLHKASNEKAVITNTPVWLPIIGQRIEECPTQYTVKHEDLPKFVLKMYRVFPLC